MQRSDGGSRRREALVDDARAALASLASATPDTPRIGHDIATDTVTVSIQPPARPGRMTFYLVDPDIEVQFDSERLGRLLGVVIRSPRFARTAAWKEQIVDVLGPVIARHVQSIADPWSAHTDRAHTLTDPAFDQDALTELRASWRVLHQNIREARGETDEISDDVPAASLVERLREAVARRGYVLTPPSWPRIGLLQATRGDQATKESTLSRRFLHLTTAQILGVEREIQVHRSTTPVGVTVTVHPLPGSSAALAIQTPDGMVVPFEVDLTDQPPCAAPLVAQLPGGVDQFRIITVSATGDDPDSLGRSEIRDDAGSA